MGLGTQHRCRKVEEMDREKRVKEGMVREERVKSRMEGRGWVWRAGPTLPPRSSAASVGRCDRS